MTEQEPIDVAVEQEQEPEQELQSPAEEKASEGLAEGQDAPDLEPAQEETPEPELSESERLQLELEQVQAKAAEYLDGWQRARAEFANYRRREEQRRQQLEDTIKGQVLAGLLPVMDDLDRAFQAVPGDVCETAWVKGLSMVGEKLQSSMEKAGVVAMAVQPGDAFDPNVHQAVFHGPSTEYAEGQIVEVFQRGYTLGEVVLRPAMVYVSSGAPEEPCAADDGPAEDGESGESAGNNG